MHAFLDELRAAVEPIEHAPAAVETTIRSLMSWLKTTTRDANVHAFADAVMAHLPELVGAGLANTAGAPQEGAAEPEGEGEGAAERDMPEADGADAAVALKGRRRERPSAQEVKTSAPAVADNDGAPPTPVEPDTAPSFSSFSQHADAEASRPDPRAR